MGQLQAEQMYQKFSQIDLPISNDTPVNMKDFLKKYSQIKDLDVFHWMFIIFKGYENKNLNYEESLSAS